MASLGVFGLAYRLLIHLNMDLKRVLAILAFTITLTSCGMGANLSPPSSTDDLGALGDAFGKRGTLIGNTPSTSFTFDPDTGEYICSLLASHRNDLQWIDGLVITGFDQLGDIVIVAQMDVLSLDASLRVSEEALKGLKGVGCSAVFRGGSISSESQQDSNCNRADLNQSGKVDTDDLRLLTTELSRAAAERETAFDVNGDGRVTPEDITHLLYCFGPFSEAGGEQ